MLKLIDVQKYWRAGAPGSCRSVNAKVTRSGEVTPSARQPARRGQCAAGARHDHTPATPTRHAPPPSSHVRLPTYTTLEKAGVQGSFSGFFEESLLTSLNQIKSV